MFTNGQTDQPTDPPTDKPTNQMTHIPSYTDAWAHLKTVNVLLITLIAFIGTAILFFFARHARTHARTQAQSNKTAARLEIDDQHKTPPEGFSTTQR